MTLKEIEELLDMRIEMGSEMAPYSVSRHNALMKKYAEHKRNKITNNLKIKTTK